MNKTIIPLTLFSLFFFISCGKGELLEVINKDTGEVAMTQEELDRTKLAAVEMGIAGENNQSLEILGADDFENEIKNGEYTILDFRTNAELKAGILAENIVQIDVYEDPDYLEKLQKLDPDEKYAIYCRSGGRTSKMMTMMEQFGFQDVIELEGGILNWSKSGKSIISYDSSKVTKIPLEQSTNEDTNFSENLFPEIENNIASQ